VVANLRGNAKAIIPALAIGVVAVVVFFASYYVFYGYDGLPIGWDTAHYLDQMIYISKNGIFGFLHTNGLYNVGYAILSSMLVILGASPFVVEMFVPIALCISIVLGISMMVMKLEESRVRFVLVAVFAPTWYAVYRLGADLHANLLALLLLLFASYFFLLRLSGKSGKLTLFSFLFFMFLASFTHIETTIFFAMIFLLTAFLYSVGGGGAKSSFLALRKTSIEMFLMIFSLVPSIIVYFDHMNGLLEYSGGILVSYSPLSLNQWLQCLGVLFPIAFLGLLLTFYRILNKSCRCLDLFAASWASVSLILGILNYALPSIQTFSYRALILFPVPLLTALGLETLFYKIPKWFYKSLSPLSFFRLRQQTLRDLGLLLALTILSSSFFGSMYFVYSGATYDSRIWIQPTTYEKLQWLSANYKPSSKPIFIFNSNDEYAGGLSDLYDNWVQIVYGDHYSYLGNLDFLLSLSETPFTSATAQIYSRIFIDEMKKDGVFNMPTLLQHSIVILTDFYSDQLTPSDNAITEIHEGIFIVNPQEFVESQSLNIPLYSRMTENSSTGWYSVARDWCKSIYALEFYNQTPKSVAYSEFLFAVPKTGEYTLTLRYWDAKGPSDLAVGLNDALIGTVSYQGTQQPANFTANVAMQMGANIFRITLQLTQGKPQYASLDYLEVTFEG
jgi:hypothetical protein